MSVINQVLNQLEQRGANAAQDQTMVRAVPPARRNFTMPLLVFGLALIAGIAAWQWVQQHKPNVAAVSVALPQPVVAATAPIASPFDASRGSAQASGVSVENQPAKLPLPDLQLSFELNSVPLPSSLRQGSGQALQDEKNMPSSDTVGLVQPDNEPAKPYLTKTTSPKTKAAVQASSSALPMKQVSPAQRADAEFRKAVALMQQGRIADALAGYEAALRLDAGHDAARQAMVALLLENKRGEDAERVLQERLKGKPDHTGFAMLLARLQVDRGAAGEATATLERSLPYASQQADYHAFLAALLQRLNRNEEAITHYQIVTQLVPGNGVWLMGYGISLQAMKRNADAKEAFKKALDTQTLSPDLQAFVQQKLKEL